MIALMLMATAAQLSCIPIPPESDRITAGDLAAQVAIFAAAPASSPVGFAPVPGARRTLGPGELERIAKRLGLAGTVETGVCVEREVAALDPARMLEAMRRTLPDAQIEIKDHSRYPAPPGEIEFPLKGLQASGLWSGMVRYGPHGRFRVWARVSATVTRTEVVAVEPLVAGRAVTAEQVKLDTVTRAPGPNAVESLEAVVGRMPTRGIAKGAGVRAEWLVDAPEIARGDSVNVEVRHGGARLSVQAVAESGGRRGDRIALRNPETKRRFLAQVAGKGQAVIEGPSSEGTETK